MSRKVNVLYYHRVFGLKEDINLLCVTPAKFEQQMRYLKKKYEILRFEEEWDRDGVVITFDDGYLDNFQYALPVLEELEIPATIFVTTGTLENNCGFWWDELERLILADDNDLDFISIQDRQYGCKWNTETYELKQNCYYALHYMMKSLVSVDTRNHWLEQLREQRGINGPAEDYYRTLNRQTCRELAASKYITIGAHTVSHAPLARMSVEDQHFEIAGSKEYLESLLNRKIESFSYPFGTKYVDFDEKTIQICKETGIKKAAATIHGIWTGKYSNYVIPRNVVRNWGISEFQSRMDSYWEGELL